MDRDIANIAAGTLLVLVAAALYAYTVSAGYRMGSAVAFDAGLMPRLWLAVAGLCAAAMAGKGVMGRLRRPGAAAPLAAISRPRLLVAFGLTAAFLAAFAHLGYWLPTLVFIPAFSLCFGYRNLAVIVLATALFAGLTWLVFVDLLEVQIPALPAFATSEG